MASEDLDYMQSYQDWTRETALYPGANEGTTMALAYVGLGLGEAGEVQGKIKKVIRDNGGLVTSEARNAILDEASDVMWYLARLFAELDTNFYEVAQLNKTKLLDRKNRGVLTGSGDKR